MIEESSTARAIERGLGWFAENETGTDTTSVLLLDYLARKFPLDRDMSAIIDTSVARMADDTRPFLRLTDPSTPMALERLQPEDRFGWPVLSGLYCDRYPLTASYRTQMEALTDMGGYELTHAALGIELACERGCLSYRDMADLIARQNESMALLPARNDFSQDLTLEAIALLLHRDAHALVDTEWVETVLDRQRPDGGWGSRGRSDAHATMLALWILLEVVHPEASDVPIAVLDEHASTPGAEISPSGSPPRTPDEAPTSSVSAPIGSEGAVRATTVSTDERGRGRCSGCGCEVFR